MKKRTMLFLIPLLFLFAGAVNNAAAQDSGEERTIDVTEWQCWLCGKQFFTLTPDDINANTKPQHKEFNFQQATWRILKDGSTIRKCEKAHDGAHIMLKKRDFQTSGYIVMTNAERYIVVRGASAIRTPINVVQCVGCQKTALCFKGDDLDEWGFLSLNKVTNVFAMKSGSKIGSCDKITLPGMTKLVPHLFNVRTTKSICSFFRCGAVPPLRGPGRIRPGAVLRSRRAAVYLQRIQVPLPDCGQNSPGCRENVF